jgi:cytochrome c
VAELAGKGVSWDDANLMAYLENPSAFLAAKTPGAKSKMALLIKDEAERRAAIDYLKTLK